MVASFFQPKDFNLVGKRFRDVDRIIISSIEYGTYEWVNEGQLGHSTPFHVTIYFPQRQVFSMNLPPITDPLLCGFITVSP